MLTLQTLKICWRAKFDL